MVKVEVIGIEDLKAGLAAVSEVVRGKAMTRALLDGAEWIRTAAKNRAPTLQDPKRAPRRKPGVLRSAITAYPLAWNHVIVRVRNRGNPQRQRAERGRARRGADSPLNPHYWWHLEFGTRRAAARPFLRPAFHAMKHVALRSIVQALREPIATAARHRQRARRGR